MVNVRTATLSDLPQYLALAQEFHNSSPMRKVTKFDLEGYAKFYSDSLDNPDVGLWLAELNGAIVGITGAIAYSLYFSPKNIAVQELWWWLTPYARGTGAGKQMFNCIESWAKEKNAAVMFMIALEDERSERMEKLYKRAGFKPLERTFIKEVM